MKPFALLVDTNVGFVSRLRTAAEQLGYEVDLQTQFETARLDLPRRPLAALVTNIRLGSFNGIHLAYLAKHEHPGARTIVYTSRHDAMLASEARHAGAFYERQASLPFSLARFLTATLPPEDRRNTNVVDRRTLFRGGRRTTDVFSLHTALAT